MKKIVLLLIIVSSLFSCKEENKLVTTQQNTSYKFVNDFSKVFSRTELDSLSLKIQQYEDRTTNEIAVVTKDSITEDIVLYAVNLANEMGVGKKDKDNGVLILIVKNLRQVNISTGYGTENILTDSICQVIIDKQMIPEFKKGKFYRGIDNAIDEIIVKWTSK